ncbi:TIGR04338 family metallohydrolase [Williamsia sp. CHRR-6]|uniref:TIGR04338 family metallohydrolase n=1 Tax=Williamsia sp. CHRR-6 TaxID=2835871 RepID=UPI001BDA2920|nr:TIGR04338 family metallohydrolase [Williamsia sp. CHRR-6]MBT0565891.1 TIGR04338 family metallohydrolase [Williamsia sp. CHRR-6]
MGQDGRDHQRAALYAAEALVHSMFDAPTSMLQVAGTTITRPAEARFGSVQAVTDHVARVLQRPTVREAFPRATRPVAVRTRRGHRSAHYEPGPPAVIALPESSAGRWALRELVVLHELAHHLAEPGTPAHGGQFAATLIDLVTDVMGPEAGFVFRVVFGDAGVRVG